MADAPTKVPFEPTLIARLTGAAGAALSSWSNAWMSPGTPLPPQITAEQAPSVQGRAFDFGVNVNAIVRPRSNEPISFYQLHGLAEHCDILRCVIETRKDQVAKLGFSIRFKDNDEKDPDSRCKMVESALLKPDGDAPWSEWLRSLLEDMFVIDAATIYPRKSFSGKVLALELIDGSTIKRVIDERGRTPQVPLPAYQQVLKGLPVADYTRDELLYMPRNRRTRKIYGYSPVEQVINTVNIQIRRAIYQLQYYTHGSTPDLILTAPPSWQMAQIREFNDYWDDQLSGNTDARRKARVVPNGVQSVDTKAAILKDEYDEWLARIICYCFSVSPTPFVKQNNRATAESAQEQALQEGLQPILQWVKSVMDIVLWTVYGFTDLEFIWDTKESVAVDVQAKIDDLNIRNGSKQVNEIRAARGDDPLDFGELNDVPLVLTPTGFLPIEPPEEPEPAPIPPGLGGMAPTFDANGNSLPAPPLGAANAPAPKGAKPAKGKKGAAPPADGDDDATPPKAKGKKGTKAAATAKIAKRRFFSARVRKAIDPIDRDRPFMVTQREALAKKLAKILKGYGKTLAAQTDLKKDKHHNAPDEDTDATKASKAFFAALNDSLTKTAADGVDAAAIQIDFDGDVELNLANENAVEWATNRAAELVGKRASPDGGFEDNPNPEYSILESTREMIRGTVAQAMSEGWSNDRLADEFSESYAFSESRAETIARTETASADTQGNLALYKSSGEVESKEWQVGAECCDECDDLDGEIVKLDDAFSDGSDGPPAHPNCRCNVLPVLTAEADDASEDDES